MESKKKEKEKKRANMESHIPHSQRPQSNREKTNTQISLIQSAVG